MKIKTGKGFGESRLTVSINPPKGSESEFEFGDLHDRATGRIDVFERDIDLLAMEVGKLEAMLKSLGDTPQERALKLEGEHVAKEASAMIAKRSFAEISMSALRTAAKFAGDIGTPTLGAAVKVIELVHKLTVG